MAFTSGFDDNNEVGNTVPLMGGYLRIGWFKSAAGSTGGTIKTGFSQVIAFFMQIHKASCDSFATVDEVLTTINQPMPGNVTIVTTADAVGKWMCIGI